MHIAAMNDANANFTIEGAWAVRCVNVAACKNRQNQRSRSAVGSSAENQGRAE
jgi:hypothetical protein